MTRGQPVSDAIQWTIICLSVAMPMHEISGYTDTSVRKIRDNPCSFQENRRDQVFKARNANHSQITSR